MATTTTAMETAPASSSSSKRYDRQLRVWGPQGQEALGRTNVAVLGSGPAASEALKNLVLGGIGSFVVVDDAIVRRRERDGGMKEGEKERGKVDEGIGFFFLFRWPSIDRVDLP